MNLTLSAPSKTFLSGEYAVMAKGPALILNTLPRFELAITRGDGQLRGLPQGAPAEGWLRARAPVWAAFDIEFRDPHKGAGGLGASGAQFLLAHSFTTWLQSSFSRALAGPDFKDLWLDLQVLSEGRGSGADVLSQAVGQVAAIQIPVPAAHALPWPYPELEWTIVRTHQKVATHEHLAKLDRESLSLLQRPAFDCLESFGHAASEVFVSKLKNFAERLGEADLVAPATRSLVRTFLSEEWCVFAKGCGALGADTVLVFYPSEAREKALAFTRRYSLTTVASTADLTHGLEVKWHCM